MTDTLSPPAELAKQREARAPERPLEAPPTLEQKYGTVSFSRKVNDGDYGHTEAAVFMPFPYSGEKALDDLAIEQAFETAKVMVYEELGITTERAPSGVVTEAKAVANVQAAFPGATVAPQAPAAPQGPPSAPQAPASGGGDRSPYKVYKRITDPDTGEKMGNPPWFDEQVRAANAKAGANEVEFWDNRDRLPQFGGNGNPNAPWFKGKNNGDVAVWPPR
jgi:hypothetical protein